MAATAGNRLLRPRQAQLTAPSSTNAAARGRQAKPAHSKGAARIRPSPVWACPGPAGSTNHPSLPGECSARCSSLTLPPPPPVLSPPPHVSSPLSPSLSLLTPPESHDPVFSSRPMASDWSCLNIWTGIDFSPHMDPVLHPALSATLASFSPHSSPSLHPPSLPASPPPFLQPSPVPTPVSSPPASSADPPRSALSPLTSFHEPSPNSSSLSSSSPDPIPGSIGLLNARSAIAHAVEIHDLVTDLHLQTLAITESWLKPSSTPQLHDLVPQNFHLISKPRVGRTGGGVAMLHHTSVHFSSLPLSPEPSTFECLLTKGAPLGIPATLFLTIYHPPEDHGAFLEELQLLLEDLVISHDRIIVWGDFNIHFNKPNDPYSQALNLLMSNLQFSQHHSDPTHRLGNQLDLLFYHNLLLEDCITSPLPWGDHCLVQASLSSWLPSSHSAKPPQVAEKILVRSFKSLTLDAFSSFWVSCNTPNLPTDELDAIMHTKLVLARNQLCPIRSVRKKSATHLRNKWFTAELLHLKSIGRSLYRRWKKKPSRTNLLHWQRHQVRYKSSISLAKRKFAQQSIHSIGSSSRNLFKLANILSTVPALDPPPLPTDPTLCHGLANFFYSKVTDIRADLDLATPDPALPQAQLFFDSTPSSSPPNPAPPIPLLTSFAPVSQAEVRAAILRMGPSSSILDPLPTPILKTLLDVLLPDLTLLVNTSLAEGHVPQAWKKGIVTPLLKKAGLDPKVFKHYRPISQLRFMARLVESIVTHQLRAHLELHHLLHDCQSGFRPGRGTELAVAAIRESLLQSADHGHSSLLILLDLSAAFDTVDHTILSSRLEEVAGVSGSALAWILSFLSGRVQSVRCGDSFSCDTPVPCGVPQGSSLSPILFNIYMRPLATLLDTIGLPFHCYADDTQLLVDLHHSSTHAARLAPGLILVQEWMRQSKLKLNGDKTELLVLPGSKTAPIPSILWPPSWGSQPSPSPKVRDLGIWISPELDGSAQAVAMAGAGHFHLSTLAKIFPHFTLSQKITLYHAFVGSRLSYGLFSLLGSTLDTIHRLQKVQNRAIRSIFNLPWRTHISPWRQKLGWLDISSNITFRTCLWLWKAIHHQGPSYIRQWAPVRRSIYPLRPCNVNNLLPLKVRKSKRGGRTIAHRGAMLWNSLPAHLRSLKTYQHFKQALKAHLLSRDVAVCSSLPSRPTLATPQSNPVSGPTLALPPSLPTGPVLDLIRHSLAASPAPARGPPFTGLSSPPLPRRDNLALIQLAAANKQRLVTSGYYQV